MDDVDIRVQREIQVPKALQVIKVKLAVVAQRAPPVSKETREPRVIRVQRVRQVHQVAGVKLDALVIRVLQAKLEPADSVVPLDLLDPQRLREIQEPRETLERRAQPAQQDRRAIVDILDAQAQQAPPVLQAPRETLAQRVSPVQRAPLVCRAIRDPLETLVQSVQVDILALQA